MSFVDELFNSFRNPKTVSDPLPKAIALEKDASQEDIFRALSINTFLLAVKESEANGARVLYTAASKKAEIYHQNGSVRRIKHD